MKRNDLPDLSKPLRTLDFDQKREKLKFQNVEEKFQKTNKLCFVIPHPNKKVEQRCLIMALIWDNYYWAIITRFKGFNRSL